MKIIDFAKRGNLVRFYLGADDCDDYYGDDWNDRPYEHNAGTVYDEFVTGTMDVVFPFRCLVMEPSEDWHNDNNSPYCKDDMKARLVPCIIAVDPGEDWHYHDEFNYWLSADHAEKIYFGDNAMDLLKLKDPIILNAPKDVLSAMVTDIVSRAANAVQQEEEEHAD